MGEHERRVVVELVLTHRERQILVNTLQIGRKVLARTGASTVVVDHVIQALRTARLMSARGHRAWSRGSAWITLQEAQRRAPVSDRQLRRWGADGLLGWRRSEVLVNRADLEALERQRRSEL